MCGHEYPIDNPSLKPLQEFAIQADTGAHASSFLLQMPAAAKDMIEELDELVQVGFRGREQKRVADMITGVRRSEHNIDSILLRAKQTLFESEKGMEPVSVMFWHQLIDLLGNISDQAENVADRLLLFISR